MASLAIAKLRNRQSNYLLENLFVPVTNITISKNGGAANTALNCRQCCSSSTKSSASEVIVSQCGEKKKRVSGREIKGKKGIRSTADEKLDDK